MISQQPAGLDYLPLEAKNSQLNSLPPVVLTVYFSGSNQSVTDTATLAGLLFKYNQHNSTGQMTRGFDGCAIVGGNFLGGIFGVGLDGQVREVVRQVHAMKNLGKKVILNCYGHSRGAIAALLLTKLLWHLDGNSVEVNLALLDPVPGNLPFAPKLDFLGTTLTSQTMDLTSCKNLKRVLCLYPYEPLPYMFGHAPLIPTYPEHCTVEEDVILGCHSSAQFLSTLSNDSLSFSSESFITFARVIDFLKQCGSKFEFGKLMCSVQPYFEHKEISEIDKEQASLLVAIYRGENHANILRNAQTRECHSDRQLQIVASWPSTPYLNLHHKQLCPDAKNRECALTIKQTPGVISAIKRRSYLYGMIKWLTIGAVIAVGLYFSGGLMALPYLTNLGAWSIVPATPSAAIVSNVFLNWLVKPLVHLLLGIGSRCYMKDNQGYSKIPDNPKQSNAMVMDLTGRATPSPLALSVTAEPSVDQDDTLSSSRSSVGSLTRTSSDSITDENVLPGQMNMAHQQSVRLR